MNQVYLGLQLQTWLVIVGIVFLALVVFARWSDGRADERKRVAKLADDAKQREIESRVNRLLAHPQPTEPPPVDYVRDGRAVPRPRSSATLAQQVDELRAKLEAGAAPAAPLTPAQPSPSTAPAGPTGGTGGSTASGTSAAPPAAGASMDPVLAAALSKLSPPK